jgi:orotate phosphoribosyltransferase
MDETTKAVIEKITRSYPKPQVLPSGHECSVYYECSRLTPNELARLGAEAMGDVPEDAFDVAVGIAYDGILFAAAIAGGRQVSILQTDGKISGDDLRGKRVVIVDDVVHSGKRVLDAEKRVQERGATVVGYACIIDRSDGRFGSPKKPLWSAFQTNML